MGKTRSDLDDMPNCVPIDQTLIEKVLHWRTYLVGDYIVPEGKYLLDRFFIQNEVHISYRRGEFRNDDFPNCVYYFIRFREKDIEKVAAAVSTMLKAVQIMDPDCEFERFLHYPEWHEKKDPAERIGK